MELLLKQIEQLAKVSQDDISLLANVSALINESMNDLNWVGFYIYKNGKLHLGPFQGKIACTPLTLDKGVCATTFNNNELLNVADVHAFPGHIACDTASASEIVIPLNNKYGVLDIDSPIKNRFSKQDEYYLKQIVEILNNHLKRD